VPIDFSKLTSPKPAPRIKDPIELFHSLRVTDTTVNDLWLAQGDALREWNEHRTDDDVAVVLNTGAGKTLVGLLVAQSLVNETEGRVAYVCSSVQLVKQTERKAEGYGFKVTTYIEGAFSNDLFQRGMAPCITTYQALFNGRSRFFRDDFDAVVFDDSHTAGHILRDQFTLSIKRGDRPALFDQLVQLYRPYFTRIRQGVGYEETYHQLDAGFSRFVPPFAVKRDLAELTRLLQDAELDQAVETKFSWRHLQDHLDQCAVFVSGTEVTFTPPVVPVRMLPYFRPGVRRVYLSATLGAEDDFLRTFGYIPTRRINPSTTAGECERLVLVPAQMNSGGGRVGDVAVAKATIRDRKALVLVPTWRRAEAWYDVATEFEGDFDDKIEAFKHMEDAACLVVPARYDGLDLPGDTCRVLVIDDLPTGMNPIERYLWERLNLAKLLRSTIASRIVQSLGRISRGMSDHGVVIITGTKLVNWLLVPKNRAMLPEFIQRQLELGLHISRAAQSPEDFGLALEQSLDRDEGWLGYYEQAMSDIQTESPDYSRDTDDALRMSEAESKFGHAFWERNYTAAAAALECDLEWTLTTSRATGAWHLLWLGVCYDALGNTERAQELFHRANGASREIPPFDVDEVDEDNIQSSQVTAIATFLRRGVRADLALPSRFDVELAPLDGNGTVSQTERALELLGFYLGFETTRPDNELGTGPDVLWLAPDGSALTIEAKTDKGQNSVYTKNDLGQLRDHLRWAQEQLGVAEIRSVFVGPLLPPSRESNPDPDMFVIELAAFCSLRDRLRAALADICGSATPVTVAERTHQVLQERNLLWPTFYEELPRRRLADLR
jgi:tetratricopeptide (TPR) repeat protein